MVFASRWFIVYIIIEFLFQILSAQILLKALGNTSVSLNIYLTGSFSKNKIL